MVTYYKVGGCVRDEIMGIKSKDIDFAVEANSYEEMREDILSRGYTIFQERPEFLSIRGRHPEYGGVDFTVCRKDGFYSDARHPDKVHIGSIFEDLARRDFTINAIAQMEDGSYIDPHNGRADIKANVIMCVGNPLDRFAEDSLRILRAIRFHIVRGFDIHTSIENLFTDYTTVESVQTLPIERIYEELNKCFRYDSWKTLYFFNKHHYLARTIFHPNNVGLALEPRIPFIAPVSQR